MRVLDDAMDKGSAVITGDEAALLDAYLQRVQAALGAGLSNNAREKLTDARDSLAGGLAGSIPLRETASRALEMIEMALIETDALAGDE